MIDHLVDLSVSIDNHLYCSDVCKARLVFEKGKKILFFIFTYTDILADWVYDEEVQLNIYYSISN